MGCWTTFILLLKKRLKVKLVKITIFINLRGFLSVPSVRPWGGGGLRPPPPRPPQDVVFLVVASALPAARRQVSLGVYAAPSLLGDSLSVQVPGIVHHKLKVSVVINWHGNIVVVFTPFNFVDGSISWVSMALDIIPVIFKSIKEFS